MCIQAASESMIMIKGLLKKLIFLQLKIIIETIITIMQTSDTPSHSSDHPRKLCDVMQTCRFTILLIKHKYTTRKVYYNLYMYSQAHLQEGRWGGHIAYAAQRR